MRRARAALALLVSALAAPPAALALADCPGVTSPGYKILLDDIAGAPGNAAGTGAADPALRLFRERVRAVLRSKLDALTLDTGSAIRLVRCDQRLPTDETDFTASRVGALDARDVLIELWGTTSAEPGTGGQAASVSRLDLALIPVWTASATDAVPAFVSIEHRSDAATPAAGVLELFQRADDVAGFSVAGLGVKWARLGDHARALRYLCQADSMLGRAPATPEKDRLRLHVQQVAKDTVARARRDPAYRGPLKLLSDAQASAPCGVQR